ncbi:hypothetical protein SBA3_2270008 [Candidatus Sulfopaludibacter sp. SbA3]|nr:hypothetical protein SBA3_2270008 [Candidatus Sulfopaludibacter sp. SbA3]
MDPWFGLLRLIEPEVFFRFKTALLWMCLLFCVPKRRNCLRPPDNPNGTWAYQPGSRLLYPCGYGLDDHRVAGTRVLAPRGPEVSSRAPS